MGHLDDLANTFWQTFYLPAGATRWTLSTPPGVADNGGLVAAVTGHQALIGFVPSAKLAFSPLAESTDQGATYTPGLVPVGLAAVPDALSVSAGGSYALTSTEVLTARSSLLSWQPSLSLTELRSSPPASRCGVEALTAVAGLSSGVVVGADCSQAATVGIFEAGPRGLSSIGPRLRIARNGGSVAVVRLVDHRSGLAVLLESGSGSARSYVPAWAASPSARWTVGPTLTGGPLISTSTTEDGGIQIVSAGPGTDSRALTIQPGQTEWRALPLTPPGTAIITTRSGRTDALAVDTNQFTDYRLVGARWVEAQAMSVPLAYGSSG